MQTRLFVFVRSAIVSTLFVGLWLWLVPPWLAARHGAELAVGRPWALAIVILAAPLGAQSDVPDVRRGVRR